MLRFRVLFFFLDLISLNSKTVLGELIHPVFFLSIILTTILILTTLLGKNTFIQIIKDKTSIITFAAIINSLLSPIKQIDLMLLL